MSQARGDCAMRLRPLLLAAVVGAGIALPAWASISSAVSGPTTIRPCVTPYSPLMTSSVGREYGAAGTTYKTLLIKNVAKGTGYACTLSGTPATQFGIWVDAGSRVFRPVGPAAMKLTFSYVKRGQTVVLRQNAVASVTVGIQTADNYLPAKCQKATATVVRLAFASGETLYYPMRTQVCTKVANTETSGVVLGTRFP
jgi:hypothetical protein